MTITGDNFPNFLVGTGLTGDTLVGLGGRDTLAGSTSGMNELFGNQGDDSVLSRGTGDTIYGGQGNDVIISRGGALIFGDKGDDSIFGEQGASDLFGSSAGGQDTISGGDGNDTIRAFGRTSANGNAGNDYLFATGADNTLRGGQGNDTVNVGSWSTTVFGDLGNDVLLTGTTAGIAATLTGLDGDDSVFAYGRSRGFGNAGADTLTAVSATVNGGQGGDVLIGRGSGVTVISGDNGNDSLVAAGSTVSAVGGLGDDSLTATASGDVTLDGGAGNDVFNVGSTAGTAGVSVVVGAGNDVVNAAGSFVSINLSGGGNNTVFSAGSNTITAGPGADTITLGAGDTVSGINASTVLLGTDSANVVVIGGSSAVSLAGNPAADTLTGGVGNDTLEGRAGRDVLTGGGGADIFLFQGDNISAIADVTRGTDRSTFPNATVSYQFPASVAGFPTGTTGTGGTLTLAGTPFTGFGNSANTAFPGTSLAFGTGLTSTYQAGGGGTEVLTLVTSGTTLTGTNQSPTLDFGYSTAGVDVITDFAVGSDQIRLSSSLFGGVLSANNVVFGTNPALGGNSLYFDPSTGYLFFSRGVIGTEAVYGTTGVQDPTGITVLPNLGQVPVANAQIATASFNFAQSGSVFTDRTGFDQPVPFLQVLNNNAPVSNLSGSSILFI